MHTSGRLLCQARATRARLLASFALLPARAQASRPMTGNVNRRSMKNAHEAFVVVV